MTPKSPRQAKRTRATNPPQTVNPPQAPKPPSESARHDGDRQALTTGQAAKHCLVSPDTIANWIAAGRLPAQRTVGGQYRIRLSDLRSFMRSHGMRTDLLDAETGHRATCWEFWATWISSGLVHGVCATCADCPVFRGRAEVCHEVRPLLPGGTQRAQSCADCQYLAMFDEQTIEER
jgi:excisionase family DNA binding protein